MKKLSNAAFLLLMLLLAACSADEKNRDLDDEKETQEEKGVSVDKGLFNVELTLPASLLEDQNVEDVIEEAESEGIKVTKNEDGSLTYKMSKEQHKKMMSEMKTSLIETIEEWKKSEDFASIQDITYNKDFSEFTLVVDKNKYENSFDGLAALGLGMSGAMYQIFNGADPDDYHVKITIKDASTQEIIGEFNYPEDLKENTEKQ